LREGKDVGMTLAEKILARASGKDRVTPGEYVTARIDLALCHDGLGAVSRVLSEAGIERVWDPERVICPLDHATPPPSVRAAEARKRVEGAVRSYGIRNYYGMRAGICHQVLPEKGWTIPGDLVVGTDSHTTTYGAFGVAGTGIGFSEMAYVLATGRLWFRVPETIRFVMSGRLPDRVSAKDVILHIAGRHTATAAQYQAVEFAGPLAADLSIAGRMTMSNMSVEIGAKFGFFAPDRKVRDFLAATAYRRFDLIQPDGDAVYRAEHKVDVASLEPQVSLPYAVDNVRPISQIGEIPVQQAVLGSCTNGRLEDLAAAADILRRRKVHRDTRLLVIPASAEVLKDAIAEGILYDLVDAGAILCPPGCGPCFGSHMGLLAAGESCIASINRNFKGRMGSPESKVYLASPATVAASAVEGRIADPRGY
jgi:homoaconitate hydratase family protein